VAHRRTEHELAAALGNHESRNHLEQILRDDSEAERQLQIQQRALPLALERLKSAENAHRTAEAEWRKAEVNRLARERVAAAAEIGKAFAYFSKAWANYSALGDELLGLASQEPNSNALYLAETISGEARLVASLPAKPFLAIREKFNFMPISTSKSFAAAEASYWRLSPPVEEAA
ncbi:MAG TPA: hypothetical protein VNX28_10210, partial [Gemmataceae bacterium]|nr:hypothetical protein [Gemmataceae bacterium]